MASPSLSAAYGLSNTIVWIPFAIKCVNCEKVGQTHTEFRISVHRTHK